MSSHPDADNFVRNCLRNPTDVSTRLVFADWLEETGEPSNVAWGRYLRLQAEASSWPLRSTEQRRLETDADEIAPDVRANLTLPAYLLVSHLNPLLQLLPAQNYTVKLTGFEVPRAIIELMPESVARENLVLPLDLQGRCLLVATGNRHNSDTIQKLQFILNKDVVAVRAEEDDVRDAISRHYGDTEYEFVDSVFVEFIDTSWNSPGTEVSPVLPRDSDIPVVQLVNLIFVEALRRGADGIQLVPGTEGIAVRYRIRGEWFDRDTIPTRLGQAIANRIAIMGEIDLSKLSIGTPVTPHEAVSVIRVGTDGASYSLRVTIRGVFHGHSIDLDVWNESDATTRTS